MTVELATQIKSFTGLSTDTKPTTEVPPGSLFYEADTGAVLKYNGVVWGLQSPGIDFSSGQILAGFGFLASHKFAAVADAASVEVFIQVGSTKNVIGNAIVSATGAAEFLLFEGTTVSDAGSAVASFNKNRESANTADATVTHTPTTTGDGLQLGEAQVSGSTVNNSAASSIGGVQQTTGYVLALDTDYLIRATNVSGGAQDMVVNLLYLEKILQGVKYYVNSKSRHHI